MLALWLCLRVLNERGSGTGADIMQGINYAASSGVDIINMSLGGYFYSRDYQTCVLNAYKKGVAVFSASGNDGSSIATYPACYDGAIAVGATTPGNVRTAFSNYGSWVKFLAPGDNLYSTYYDGRYEIMSGTSQATPVVSGTAAVILSARPDIKAKSGKARVDALVAAMNKGKVNDIVSLTKALGISASYEKPKAPVFAEKKGTYNTNTHKITINKSSAVNTIYYSVDGNNIIYKDGILSENARKYTEPVTIGNAAKVTVKAIEVNPVGIAGPVATATYTFKPSATGVKVSGSNILLVNKSTKLTAEVVPEYAADKKVIWDISPKNQGITVSNGTVKATAKAVPGKYTISVKSNDKNSKASALFYVTVKDKATVKKIGFTKSKDTVFVGGNAVTYDLKSVLDVTLADGKSKGSINNVTWDTSDAKIATVGNNGVLTAKAGGTAKITAIANDGSGIKGVFTLTVKQYATKILLSGANTIAIGNSSRITAAVGPETAAKTKLAWEVSPKDQGVTVSNGTVKVAKNAKAGKYKIVARALDRKEGAASGAITITVSDNAIQNIKLSSTKATIYRKKASASTATSCKITATVTAKTAGGSAASSANVEFTSSNPGVATVTYSGNVATVTATGKVAGTTKITCRALDGSNKSATCTVTVANPVSKLFISAPVGNEEFGYGAYAKGAKVKLKANFENQYGKVSKAAVTWSSSNDNVVSVDKKGMITVKGAKSGALITAKTADGATAVFPIYTFNKYNNIGLSVDLNKENYYIRPKQHIFLRVLFDGKSYREGGYCPQITVEVKDKDILQVIPDMDSETCYVEIAATGKKMGKTSFTIKANDGSGKKVTYSLAVGEY
ncbi:MAG: S8 family serine peptidase [Lachnospiraceae bacterium]|nr:S8 family serine peptidase [Lachnospiraceae bacterium]